MFHKVSIRWVETRSFAIRKPLKLGESKSESSLIFDGSLDPDSEIQLALDIFFDFQTTFESFQGGFGNLGFYTQSSFSVDDLPSDFLGFMEAAGTIDIQEICSALNPADSKRVLQSQFEPKPKTNYSHRPKLWGTTAWRFVRPPREISLCNLCEGKDTSIPDIFDKYELSGNFPGPNNGFIRNGIVDQKTLLRIF